MNYFVALYGLLAVVALAGCTNAVSPQTAQSPPPSLSTPAPVAVITAAPSQAATPLPLSAVAPATTPPVAVTTTPTEAVTASNAVPEATSSVAKEVAFTVAQIRAASSEDEANRHVADAQRLASALGKKIKQSPGKAQIYAHWQTAVEHLGAAATFKANSFHAWNDLDAKSKLLSMNSELTAAQTEADTTQRLLEGGAR